MVRVTARRLAELLLADIEGDSEVMVYKPARIEEGQEGDICFLSNPRYEQYAYTTRASVLVVARTFVPQRPLSATLLRVDNVQEAVALLMEHFGQTATATTSGVDASAVVMPDAQVAPDAVVGALCYVAAGAVIGPGAVLHPQVYVGERVQVGAGTVLFSGVKVYRDCVIGQRCVIHANTVIGSDGFGFAPQPDGSHRKIPHLGNVVIGNDVEIGANVAVDRAVMGSTVLGDGVKLDNLIHIAHNVVVGQHTAIAAQAGVAGSTHIGERCMIGGQAGFVGHIKVADGTKVQAQSGVNRSVAQPGTALYGSPALSYNDYLRAYAVFRQLPQLLRRVEAVEAGLAAKSAKEPPA